MIGRTLVEVGGPEDPTREDFSADDAGKVPLASVVAHSAMATLVGPALAQRTASFASGGDEVGAIDPTDGVVLYDTPRGLLEVGGRPLSKARKSLDKGSNVWRCGRSRQQEPEVGGVCRNRLHGIPAKDTRLRVLTRRW